jgi:hypothetical protein
MNHLSGDDISDQRKGDISSTGLQDKLALASVATWLGAAALAGPVGLWPALGAAAVLLGALIFASNRTAVWALLRPTVATVFFGAAAGGAMALATVLVYPWLSQQVPLLATDTSRLYAEFRALSPAASTLALFPVIVGEELVWRGVVHSALVRRVGLLSGVALAAGVYALVHAPVGSVVLAAAAFCCGVAWSGMRALSGSLVVPMVAHWVWNLVVLIWVPLDSLAR